jgi:hypothetical protein
LGNRLQEHIQHPVSLSVIRGKDRRSLSLSIAKKACEYGSVLLVVQAQNRAFYAQNLSKEDPIVWFKGATPSSKTILSAIEEHQDHLALVILEGPQALRGLSMLPQHRMKRLVEKSPIPVTAILVEQDNESTEDAIPCSVQNGMWELERS